MWDAFNPIVTGEIWSSGLVLALMVLGAGYYSWISHLEYENEHKFKIYYEQMRQEQIRAYAAKLLKEQVIERYRIIDSINECEKELINNSDYQAFEADKYHEERANRRYNYYFPDINFNECSETINQEIMRFSKDKSYRTRTFIQWLEKQNDGQKLAKELKTRYINSSLSESESNLSLKTKANIDVYNDRWRNIDSHLYEINLKKRAFLYMQATQYGLYLFISTANMAHFIPTAIFATNGLLSLTGVALAGALMGLGVGCILITLAWAWHMRNDYNQLSDEINSEIAMLNSEVQKINSEFHHVKKQHQQLINLGVTFENDDSFNKFNTETTDYKNNIPENKPSRYEEHKKLKLQNRLNHLINYEKTLDTKLNTPLNLQSKDSLLDDIVKVGEDMDLRLFWEKASPTEQASLIQYANEINSKETWRRGSDISKNSRNIAFGIIVLLIAVGAISTGGLWAIGMGVACFLMYLGIQYKERKHRKTIATSLDTLKKDKLRAFAINLIQERVEHKQQMLIEQTAVAQICEKSNTVKKPTATFGYERLKIAKSRCVESETTEDDYHYSRRTIFAV